MKIFGWFTKIFLPLRTIRIQLPLQTWKRRRRKRVYDSSIGLLIPYLLAITYPLVHEVLGSAGSGIRSVATPFGVVRGQTILPASEDDLPAVTQYFGIPYGVAPIGPYRFNMAISAPKWTHQPKNAFQVSSVCIQAGIPHLSETEALKTMSAHRFDEIHRIFPFLKPESEDCLYMNLYVPDGLEQNRGSFNGPADGSRHLPVLVVIHGGDYGWSAGNAYNASIFAAYTQTVVVTINYRLGVYGFLGRCEPNSCTGNAGLSDLVAALKMLSNILPSFGADPSSLTLLGWGSGAALISLLMASPITQPKNRLFRRAILLDGSALCPWAMVDHPQQFLLKLAMELECVHDETKKSGKSGTGGHRSTENLHRDISHVIRCLQDHAHQNLTTAARKIDAPTFTSAFAPIIDGQIVPNNPKYSFSPKYGALFRDIDLMIGTVLYPAHHLLPNVDLESGIDPAKRDKIYRTLVRNLFNFHRTEIFNALLNEYMDWENPKNHPKTLRGNVLAALGDALFVAPLIRTARMHSTDEVPKTSNTYMFVFAHETNNQAWSRHGATGRESGVRGSLSDDHLPYIFGYPLSVRHRDSQDYGRFTSDDKGISRVLMQYISNFVKSGDPAKPQTILTRTSVEERFFGTPWPQYGPATREAYLEISDRPRVKNYYRNSYVGFWNSFIPQLNRDSRDAGVPEEHNFLPNHFKRDSFFGTVRHYSSFHNEPFPPPPMPPTPFPIEALKKTSSAPVPAPTLSTGKSLAEMKEIESRKAKGSNIIVITVCIGTGFLVLNLCIYTLMFRKCSEWRRRSKKRLRYQSYTVGHPSTSEINFASNSSPLGQFPAVLSEANLKTDEFKLASPRETRTRRLASPVPMMSILRNGDLLEGRTVSAYSSAGAAQHRSESATVPKRISTSAVVDSSPTLEKLNLGHRTSGSMGSMSKSLQTGNSRMNANNRGSVEVDRHLNLNEACGSVDNSDRMTKSTLSTSTFSPNGGAFATVTTSTVRRMSPREQVSRF